MQIPPGQHVTFRPHDEAFLELAHSIGPRELLELAMRNYSVLSKGERILIDVADTHYHLDVVKVAPGSRISLLGTVDLEVEFAPMDATTTDEPAPASASAGAGAGSGVPAARPPSARVPATASTAKAGGSGPVVPPAPVQRRASAAGGAAAAVRALHSAGPSSSMGSSAASPHAAVRPGTGSSSQRPGTATSASAAAPTPRAGGASAATSQRSPVPTRSVVAGRGSPASQSGAVAHRTPPRAAVRSATTASVHGTASASTVVARGTGASPAGIVGGVVVGASASTSADVLANGLPAAVLWFPGLEAIATRTHTYQPRSQNVVQPAGTVTPFASSASSGT
ncbi:MAG: hypothetical protein EOO41_05215, partial [Methanobacteriota archaeon]